MRRSKSSQKEATRDFEDQIKDFVSQVSFSLVQYLNCLNNSL